MAFRLSSFFLIFLSLVPILLGICVVRAANSREKHSAGYCAMYDICGQRSDGKVLNCPYGSPSVKPDALFSSKVQSLCPTITGNVCCTEGQFDTLRTQVQQAIPLLVGCPACLRNFLNLFCEMSCSPNQSLFINVTSTKKVSGNLTVDAIDFHVMDAFGEGLYNSCKDVKFGTMNTLAINFVAGGAQNFTDWYKFIGRQVGPNEPGSPYAINFNSNVDEVSGVKPMNVSTYSCGDTSLGCSCGDCSSSPTCSNSAPPSSHKGGSCRLRIGSLHAKCIDVALSAVYIALVFLFFGWGYTHQKKRTDPISRTNSVMNAPNNEDLHVNRKSRSTPMPILEDGMRIRNGIKLSLVQGYLSKFYRSYGIWVARRSTLVLILSLGTVLVLCLGLIRFKVETRPEKLWVGHGSRAAREKQFFDSHLAPFYRIEELIIATMPSEANGKSPSILTDDNLNLLFEIQKKVDGLRANYSGSVVSLTDICLKPLGGDCATQSVLQYFKMDSNNFDGSGVDHVNYCFQHYSNAESCLSAFKAPLDPSTAFGGYAGNNYSEASSFIVTYPVNNAIDRESNSTKMAVAWEKAFIELCQNELLPMVQSKSLTLAFSSESSIEEELKRESTADVITIVISYLVMFAYISLTLGDMPRVSYFHITSKVLLGLSGITLVLFSVLASVGFFSAIGVKSTLIIMEVIPFLVLAVGVDNMCILVHAVKRQPQELPLEGRISNALGEVGPSITLASLSEVLAFAVGSFIPMPAVRVFSMFAALAVLVDFLLQVTAFVALIVFDFLRTEDYRVDCVPCIRVSSIADSNHGICERKPGFLARYMKGRYEIMRNYMPKVGSLGLDMMFRTCTVQVNLDFSSEADMIRKFRAGLALQPALSGVGETLQQRASILDNTALNTALSSQFLIRIGVFTAVPIILGFILEQGFFRAMDRFRGNGNGILIATDVAARGLDIPGVRTVIHYQLPHSAEVYVHRSGRTARASRDGCSVALISPNDRSKFASLCKSFSKESLRHFPVDSSYMPEALKRLSFSNES